MYKKTDGVIGFYIGGQYIEDSEARPKESYGGSFTHLLEMGYISEVAKEVEAEVVSEVAKETKKK